MTTPTIHELNEELARCRSAEASLGARGAAYRSRLPELAQELATAMADGNEQRVNELRAERANAEAELRDIDAAQHVAAARIAAADRACARIEAESLFSELRAERDAFLSELTALNRRSSAIREKRRQLVGRFAVAGFEGGLSHPLHPAHASRLGPVGGHVFTYLADFPGDARFRAE